VALHDGKQTDFQYGERVMTGKDPDQIDIDYVAQLARIGLSEQERSRFRGQLEAVLGYMRKLDELELDGIEPTAHAMPIQNVWREDRSRDWDVKEMALKNAPARMQDSIQVPKIVDTSG
jgi:aspartyl-tRNA(Asn)/glutamyl-tRNA(Gln) amidotransferase subunit C